MQPEIDDTLLTAYALGELDARERARVAAHVEADGEARRYVEEVRETAGLITDHLGLEPADGLTVLQHESIERRLRQVEVARSAAGAAAAPLRLAPVRPMRLRQWLPLAASLAASIAIVCGSLAVLLPWMYPRPAMTQGDGRDASWQVIRPGDERLAQTDLPGPGEGPYARDEGATNALPDGDDSLNNDDSQGEDDWDAFEGMQNPRLIPPPDAVARQEPVPRIAPPTPAPTPTPVAPPAPEERVAGAGGGSDAEDLRTDDNSRPGPPSRSAAGPPGSPYRYRESISVSVPDPGVLPELVNNESAAPQAPKVYENPFRLATQRPRSAFPVRVETGSYKVVRSDLLERKLPPPHVVRIEELVNRFRYDYAPPADPDAALVATIEIAACPWNVRHRLARVAIKAREGGATVVARGVQVGVEFNPIATAQWRLIGYENAPMAQTQPSGFAANLAAAGTATAFYEIVPVSGLDPRTAARTELFTLSVRYRDPADGAPHKFELPAADRGQGFDRASGDFRFAASVAAFGMLLRDSQFKGAATYADVIRWANSARGPDATSERAAFIELARFARDAAKKKD